MVIPLLLPVSFRCSEQLTTNLLRLLLLPLKMQRFAGYKCFSTSVTCTHHAS